MSDACHHIHSWANDRRRFSFPFDVADIPKNGIYILFEKGELAHGGDRIVRVGTHVGQNQLRSRLKEHFLRENKDRSIFRKNIGRALLASSSDPFAMYWELDLTTRQAQGEHARNIDWGRKDEIERDVSKRIQSSFTFTVIEISTKEERLRMESRLISSVSLCNDCRPSVNWLGKHSPKAKIRDGGLWQVNELYKEPLSAQDFSIYKLERRSMKRSKKGRWQTTKDDASR